MKTHTIKTPTAELLVVELPETGSTFDILTAINSEIEGYTLLGKPDEISEEDAKELVETKQYGSHPFFCTLDYRYKGKNKDGFNPGFCADDGYQFRRSLLSLIESEIYWENPLQSSPPTDDLTFYDSKEERKIAFEKWHEAEQKTFDRNRSLIFKKN